MRCSVLYPAIPFIAGLIPTPLPAQDSLPIARMERAGFIRSPRLAESSGVAVSRAYPGVLWTHNDSGDSPLVYAMSPEGDLLAAYQVRGARAVDWEDIALGPCPHQPATCLYLADTGDNEARRESVVVYAVPEPVPPSGTASTTTRVTDWARSTILRYPEGPQDVEAIAVTPAGDLFLVSKGRTAPIRVYRVPAAALQEESAIATLVDTLPFSPLPTMGRWVTGAGISPDGERMVVRTYTELYFYRLVNGKLVPEGPPCWLGAAEPQGEAVDFLDESTVVLTSESVSGQMGPILLVTCETRGRDG